MPDRDKQKKPGEERDESARGGQSTRGGGSDRPRDESGHFTSEPKGSSTGSGKGRSGNQSEDEEEEKRRSSSRGARPAASTAGLPAGSVERQEENVR